MRKHRILAALLGVAAAVGLAAAQDSASTPAPKSAHADPQHYWDCAKACDDCARVCDACGAHCAQLLASGHKEHATTLRTCQDCATVCRAGGAVAARTGPFTDAIWKACADCCKRCGEACAKHGDHDPIMKKCADECAACEKACREMLKHTGNGAGRR